MAMLAQTWIYASPTYLNCISTYYDSCPHHTYTSNAGCNTYFVHSFTLRIFRMYPRYEDLEFDLRTLTFFLT